MSPHRSVVRRLATLGLGAIVLGAVVSVGMMVTAQSAPLSGWNIVPSANTGGDASNLLLGTTCTNAWDCWAVGGIIDNLNNGQPEAMVEHWNGTAWSIDPSATPPGSQVSLLWGTACTSSSDCWAVGGQMNPNDPGPITMAEHWNGSTWSVVPTPPTPGLLFSVTCTASTNCWAAGTTQTNTSNSTPLNGFIDHWDGSSWTTVPTQPSGQTFDQFNSVTCTTAANCWAVGFAGPNTLVNGFLPNVAPSVVGASAFIEHWDGTAWTMVATPGATAPSGAYLSAVSCSGPTACWAVGATMDANGDPTTTLVDRWDGTAWTTVPSANPTTPNDVLTAVTCLDATGCWATGATGVANGQNQGSPNPFMESWDGTAWTIDPSPNVTSFGYLDGVACVAGAQCFASGFAATNTNDFVLQTLVERAVLPTAGNQGFWTTASDGGIFTFGDARFFGSTGGRHLNAPIVGMAATPDAGGYWTTASDGGIFSFGDARFHGSTGAEHLNAPIVGMAATPDGGGYWLVARDGGIFTFGDARFHGSTGGRHLNAPIVGMAATPDGGGYWLVAGDGGIFTFGDARFHGSTGAVHLDAPIVGMAATPDGGGYWLVAGDGGIFTFGDAGYFGSVPGQGIVHHVPVEGMVATPSGLGYWLVGADGAVYSYGDAGFLGSLVGFRLAAPITGAAISN